MQMRMAWCLWLLCLPGLALAQAAPEVDQAEVRRLGNLVQQLGTGPQSDGVSTFLEAMGPPASDADKWFISLVTTQGCGPCVQLKQAFGTDPWLKALADPSDPKKSWSHFNVYDAQDQSQSFRFAKLKIEAYPTILVQPPRSKKYGEPSTVVFQGAWNGDPKRLATEVTSAIRRYLAKLSEARSVAAPVGEGEVGADPPWQPTPKIDPILPLLPFPLPQPLTPPVDVVQIPPPLPTPPSPNPVTPVPTPVTPTPEPVPEPDGRRPSTRLEAVVVTDADAPNDAGAEARIREVVQGLRKQRGQHLKVRRIDWQDAASRYPLQRDEVPVVLVTSNGRIEDKISANLLPFVDPPAQPVKLTDLPWTAVLTLLTTGFSFPAAAALAVWAVSAWRATRKQSGQPLLLNDATFQQLLQLVQRLLEQQAGSAKPNPPPTPPATT